MEYYTRKTGASFPDVGAAPHTANLDWLDRINAELKKATAVGMTYGKYMAAQRETKKNTIRKHRIGGSK